MIPVGCKASTRKRGSPHFLRADFGYLGMATEALGLLGIETAPMRLLNGSPLI
jgi:hypothetical protein